MSTSGGSYVVIVTGNTPTSFTVVSLSAGIYYSFYVEARNSYGYSVPSAPITLLCAAAPFAPPAPVTAVIGN